MRQFYSVLSPTQQRTFDGLMGLMHHAMGMHAMRPMSSMNSMSGMGMNDDDDGSMMH